MSNCPRLTILISCFGRSHGCGNGCDYCHGRGHSYDCNLGLGHVFDGGGFGYPLGNGCGLGACHGDWSLGLVEKSNFNYMTRL